MDLNDTTGSIIVLTPAGRSEREQRAAAASCSRFDESYAQIDLDLALWQTGITQEDMKRTIKFNTTTSRTKGIALGFEAGRAYVVEEPRYLETMGHHVGLFHTYMRVALDLERRFGAAMPDVEFVIQTMDRPIELISDMNGVYNPIMRFCKSSANSDILIPNMHFYSKRFDSTRLLGIPHINERYPWAHRTAKAFTRFALYERHIHSQDLSLRRSGFQGRSICKNVSRRVTSCRVRKHFQVWAKRYPALLDASLRDRRPMETFAEYKYLIQLDGQGLSTKMDQLLTMGSAVLKEESGYYGHYYGLLKPYEHFLPFWKERPEDILEVLQWAQYNDAKARAIGQAGQEFALRYLNAEARACYWLTLLTRFAKLLRYKPGRANRRYPYYRPVEVYLDTVARGMEAGQPVFFEP